MESQSPGTSRVLIGQFRAAVSRGIMPDSVALPTSNWEPEYAMWRFLTLLKRRPEPSLDHGVLLRQAVRYSNDKLFVGGWTPALAAVGEACGVSLSGAGDLSVLPYRPSWLADESWSDGQGVDEPPMLATPDESIPAEPWLWSLANGLMKSWHSPAQKEACWHALTAPPGTTTLLGLPTGAGKSLSFQLIARFSSGVTIVVVPTTALAIDQCLAARQVLSAFPHLNPRYYSSNDPGNDGAAVRSALRDGTCRLLFASPEACVSGTLRPIVDELAANGRLDTVVLDEAHIVESWGGHFRVEFQLLSARLDQWRDLSGGKLRTLLLSATFTPRGLELLRSLFGGKVWREFSCQRLRPEITYFKSGFLTGAERDAALFDALRHLPRPLILYVTEVDEAKRIFQQLVDSGFKETECFHGETSGPDRRKILLAWRDNKIEIVVATSAFGMGVDKSDVRAVVHACFPESVNRYYQEVGRGGRDGAKAIALWMPDTKDRTVAKDLLPRMLGADLIMLRWQTLLAAAREEEGGILNLPMNSRHQRLMGGRSFNENIRWNKRLVLMMARSKLIEIQDIYYEDTEGEPGQRVERMRLRCNFVPSDPNLAELLKEPRTRDLAQAQRGIRSLDEYLAGESKICRLLRREYGSETIIACGGCTACRSEQFDRYSIPILDFDPPPPTNPRINIVVRDNPTRGAKALELLADTVADLITEGRILHFLCATSLVESLTIALAELVAPQSRYYYRLDDSQFASRINVASTAHVVGIHGHVPDRGLLAFRGGNIISHIFPKDALIVDANDRVLFTHEGARYFPNFNEWRAQI